MDDNDCSGFFDHIDDLMEFPSDNDMPGDSNDFPSIWNETLPDAYPSFPASDTIAATDLSAEISVPYEDIIQLEWLSTFMEDSFSGGGMTMTKDYSPVVKNDTPQNLSVVKSDTSQNQFHTCSPVSVLESSSSSSSSCSSSSGVKLSSLGPIHLGPRRARSKRPRPATFNPRPLIQFIVSSAARSFTESEHPAMKFLKPYAPEQQKKKIMKPKAHSSLHNEVNQNSTVRKCMHCEITNTPQWRTGPNGPKTLCNACGVRYKSGRLFPEYRPAASPTFSPTQHSNSHKKVVQMRTMVIGHTSGRKRICNFQE